MSKCRKIGSKNVKNAQSQEVCFWKNSFQKAVFVGKQYLLPNGPAPKNEKRRCKNKQKWPFSTVAS